jgi:glycogen(starch) synthase
MKILVLSNLYPPDVVGGYELGCKQAVDALRARGHDVQVLTSVPRTPVAEEPHVDRMFKLTDLYNLYANVHAAPATLRLWEAESSGFNAFNVHILTKKLEDFQPDVVYIWLIVGIGGLGILATLEHLRVPWVWHLMDAVPLMLCRTGDRLIPGLVREVDRQLRGNFIACSSRVVQEIEAGGIRLAPTLEVVQNWITGERPPRREAYYKGGRLRIVSAGQIAHHKGVGILIEAARLLLDQGLRDFEVDIYGQVPDAEFPSLARMSGLEEHMRFCGPRSQSELARLFRNYDVFAFPTWAREPFGFAPLEAGAQGCVPLISQVCGISEWLIHGVDCLKVSRTPRGFADALSAIHAGKVDLEPIGKRIEAVAWRDFHIDTLMPRIERILNRSSERSKDGAGTTAEIYRMAVLAERLSQTIVQEPFCA